MSEIKTSYIIGGGIALGAILLLMGRSSGGGSTISPQTAAIQNLGVQAQTDPALLLAYSQVEQNRLAAESSTNQSFYNFVQGLATINTADMNNAYTLAAHTLDVNSVNVGNTLINKQNMFSLDTARILGLWGAGTAQYTAETGRMLGLQAGDTLQYQTATERILGQASADTTQYRAVTDRTLGQSALDIKSNEINKYYQSVMQKTAADLQASQLAIVANMQLGFASTQAGVTATSIGAASALAQGMAAGGQSLSQTGGGAGSGPGGGGGSALGTIGSVALLAAMLL